MPPLGSFFEPDRASGRLNLPHGRERGIRLETVFFRFLVQKHRHDCKLRASLSQTTFGVMIRLNTGFPLLGSEDRASKSPIL